MLHMETTIQMRIGNLDLDEDVVRHVSLQFETTEKYKIGGFFTTFQLKN